MYRPFLFLSLFLLHTSLSVAQKSIYIPEDLRAMNLESETLQWC